jgi:hypothetical protein
VNFELVNNYWEFSEIFREEKLFSEIISELWKNVKQARKNTNHENKSQNQLK